MTGWKCPQHGCTRPLSEHVVTQADQYHQNNPTNQTKTSKGSNTE